MAGWCPLLLWRAKALSILGRSKESFDHLGIDVIAVELIQLGQPELVSGVVESRFRSVIRVATQVTKVFGEHKSAIELSVVEVRVFSYLPDGLSTCCGIRGVAGAAEQIDRPSPLCRRQSVTCVRVQFVDEVRRRHRRRERADESRHLHKVAGVRLLIIFEQRVPARLQDYNALPDSLRIGEKLTKSNHGHGELVCAIQS